MMANNSPVRTTDSNNKRSGQVILIPKQLRAEWMDVMALDSSLSHVAFRAAGVIGSHFNRHTGKTFLNLETLARVMDVSERTAWSAVNELDRSGYLIVKRRKFGTLTRRKKDGTEVEVRVAGGKGVANTYLPAFERSQVTATFTGSKLATRCDLSWEQRSQKAASKVATDCDPTLTSSSKKNPAPQNGPRAADALGPAGAMLLRQLGPHVFRDWFGKATLLSETDETVTLAVPDHFLASRIRQDFEPKILAAWQTIRPSIRRVEIIDASKENAK
jgi:DnaA N-terminal domain